MSDMNRITVAARDGALLAAYRFDPTATPRGAIVIAPAMAVPQSFYAGFAAYLAGQGYTTWTFDYRGTGESLAGGMRGAKADLTDWYSRDYDALINHAADAMAGKPVFAAGHSFGGQTAPLLPSRDRLAGLVNIAVGSGSMQHITPRIRRGAPLMWHVMAPLLCPLFGYFPGRKLGVVGDIPTGAMFQWRRWCLTPEYLLTGEPGAREAYASAAFPVLALTFADDEMLLEAGSRLIHGAYRQRAPDYRVIAPADVDMKRIGHFGFFKPQAEARLWPTVIEWLEYQRRIIADNPENRLEQR